MPNLPRRRLLFGTAALIVGTAGCTDSSNTEPKPTLNGVFVTNRDPEPATIHIQISNDGTLVHEESLDVEAYEPEGNRAGNAEIPPAEFEQTPGEWDVSAEFTDGTDGGSIALAESVADDDAYTIVLRIEDDEILFGTGNGFFATTELTT